MDNYACVTLRQRPEYKDRAAEWFHSKWNVPKEAYLESMDAYLNKETEYGWYLCLDGGKIVGGLGVIDNDFHDRKDLTPNICAVYTEEEYLQKRPPRFAFRCLSLSGRKGRESGLHNTHGQRGDLAVPRKNHSELHFRPVSFPYALFLLSK